MIHGVEADTLVDLGRHHTHIYMWKNWTYTVLQVNIEAYNLHYKNITHIYMTSHIILNIEYKYIENITYLYDITHIFKHWIQINLLSNFAKDIMPYSYN